MNDRYNKWLNDNGISESDKEILKNMTEKEKVVMGQKGRVKVIEEMDLEKIIDIYDYKIAAVLGEEEGITVDLQELISLRKTKKI